VGAGTVEFIANQDGSFYFMEMNTRLQVEHPVTEMITGLDLVEWQLRVASGEPLPKKQNELAIRGHALEARIYAENPEKGFLPSIGTLRHMHTPQAVTFELGNGAVVNTPAAIRIDSGVREGDAISPFYDPMIAKLIVWGNNREEALGHMVQALSEYQIVGLATNVAFLKRLVQSAPFSGADLDTGLIERNHAALFPALPPATIQVLALAGASLLTSEQNASAAANDPWANTSGWRMNGTLLRSLDFADEASAYPVSVGYRETGWSVRLGDATVAMTLVERNGQHLVIKLDGAAVRGTVVRDGEMFHVFTGGTHFPLQYNDPLAHAGEAEAEGGRLTAPMPGKIVAVLVGKGKTVEKGEPLLIMEAMKMEHTIAAPANGTVEDLLYAVGDQVTEGAQLLSFKAA
ncbi:MAG TPA: biotin/lipoyl-containing protein, partial [Noviherbaspirillum sp.]|nr:biotin/lipoyl-containing protein [Noviherbaspirillum sp.]